MVLMPNPMADQPYLARRVASLGAGIVVDEDAPPSEIRETVERVLAEGNFRQAAAAIGVKIDSRAAARAAEVVESVGARHAAAI